MENKKQNNEAGFHDEKRMARKQKIDLGGLKGASFIVAIVIIRTNKQNTSKSIFYRFISCQSLLITVSNTTTTGDWSVL